MTHSYEPDRALADLDTLALRERVRELEEAIRAHHATRYGSALGPIRRSSDPWDRKLYAALADHREGEDGG